ncbi:hypothetical protein MMC30_001203 [Trapelia coarctata]|nr:hypothetical protein [Trapelia coarctata]
MPAETIGDLAAIIAANTAKVEDYLAVTICQLHLSTSMDHRKSPIPPEAKDIELARETIIDATTKPRSLMLGPTDSLLSNTPDELLSLQAIYRFKLASSFSVHDEASFDQIAAASGLDEPNVRRILRHAMTRHIFCEPRKGIVAHTALSRLLAEDAQMNDWIGAMTNDMWPANVRTVDALEKWPRSQESNETGFALANNTTNSTYQEFARNPLRAKRFGESMKVYTESTGYDLIHLVDNYPWASLGNAKVVDIGGSHGFVSARLAESFPALHFVVQDLPSVVATGPEHLPAKVAGRITFMGHDFLTEQPVKDADIYLFRWVLHNWADKYCVQILRNLIPALKPGARVIINDSVLPEPGTLSAWPEERVRSIDLIMLVIQNSRERELDDWAKLFEVADKRFKFLGGKLPPGSKFWILEASWEP